jgi:hypothetical protein
VWRDVKNGHAYTGTLVTHVERHNGEQYSVLQLMPTDPMSAEHAPRLYEPVLLGFARLAFRLRGFERVEGRDGGYGVVQEWHVETVTKGRRDSGRTLRVHYAGRRGCYAWR